MEYIWLWGQFHSRTRHSMLLCDSLKTTRICQTRHQKQRKIGSSHHYLDLNFCEFFIPLRDSSPYLLYEDFRQKSLNNKEKCFCDDEGISSETDITVNRKLQADWDCKGNQRGNEVRVTRQHTKSKDSQRQDASLQQACVLETTLQTTMKRDAKKMK
jgi:hypothetical protein